MVKPDSHSRTFDEVSPSVVPETVEETELSLEFLADLALKSVSIDANCATDRVSDKIKLPIAVSELLLQHPYREKLLEIRGLVGFNNHRYAMLDRGWERVQRLFEMNGYVGPAPVSLSSYTAMIRSQERNREPVKLKALDRKLSGDERSADKAED